MMVLLGAYDIIYLQIQRHVNYKNLGIGIYGSKIVFT